MRPVGGAEDVVGVADVRDPVTHRLVDRFLECCLSGSDRDDLGPEKAHARDIEGLPLHIDGSHVDDTLEAEAGRDGRGRHAVLAGSGLGDDALLAHAAGE